MQTNKLIANKNMNKRGIRINNNKPILLVFILVIIAFYLFIISPGSQYIPAAILSISSFFLVQVCFSQCRPKLDYYLVPFNFSYLLFFIQLVIVPLTVAYFGVVPSTLPWLPATKSINFGLAIYSLAYLSFSLSFSYFSRKGQFGNVQDPIHSAYRNTLYPKIPIILIGFFYIVLGFIGLYLLFGSIGTFIRYISTPVSRDSLMYINRGTIAGLLSGLLRPFLSFGIALVWAFWFDKYYYHLNRIILSLGTGLALLLVVISGISFNYNRASFFVPGFSLMAAYFFARRNLSTIKLVLVALFFSGLLFSIGSYRNYDNPYYKQPSILETIQVYGGGPQFLGFYLEGTGFGKELYLGETLLASLLYPIPVLGKEFRSISGVGIYNFLIYGNNQIIDAILPFQGELFSNFHLVGIIIGYSLLGFFVYQLDSAFRKSQNSFERYGIFVISYWVCYMILGSLAILSQQFIGVFWPFYIYIILKTLNPRTLLRRIVS